ncbi:hypothetical protein SCP_0212020 [Sparassis crispa]|uniref:Uncharacterized protein n=1 Tax=Sparassis crispa TaxID=139825 RepID=A0A401GCX1_9APHY|nr:hypothetical protein SCP_0212020 [Sparassis crispa]GBE80000.1 hypothetical protein SCP_0212020 [Sparassis crispa]
MTTLVSLSEYANAFEKLDTTGRNWLMFQHRLEIAVHQKGVWSHFDGSLKKLIAADPGKPTADETDLIQEWQKKENLALYLLTSGKPHFSLREHLYNLNGLIVLI